MTDPIYKRPFDIFVLLTAHIILFPLWLFLWIIIPLFIYLEDGRPVFYGQKRVGRGNREFTVYKFRTMVKSADKIGPTWTLEGDPRVTKVGRILRKTALDELPSLWSILKGDMSFVGPRALVVEEQRLLEKQIPGFEKRLAVRPGLTGLAQVYNPEDDPYLKLRYDIEYIEKMSLWLDIKLMLLSVWNTIFARWDKRKGKQAQGGLGGKD
jgi:lipopolysaccharide/colanic/teichoic acid biosynthesis glycosyltransferase